jgi:hypothetical protein
MATLETFTFSPSELGERYTLQTHETLRWLQREKYITEAQCDDLLGRLLVVSVPNKPGWGCKILARLGFSDKEKDSNSWTFPIAQLEKLPESIDVTMKRKK